MPRTAKTLAVTHDGKEVLLSGKTVPIQKQLEQLRQYRGIQSHKDYSEVNYQESDGPEQVFRFRSPADQKKHDDMRAKELAAAKSAGAKLTNPEKKTEEQAEPRPPTPDPVIPANEFKREELQTKEQGELLAIVKTLVEAKRIEAPSKTAKSNLVEAILAAKPITPPAT